MTTSRPGQRPVADQPTDVGVDRRAFIERMAALTSVAALGGATLPSPLQGLDSTAAVAPPIESPAGMTIDPNVETLG